MRYRIVEQEDGRFIIVSSRDESLCWAGSHWSYLDQGHPPLINFTSYEAAQHYARKILRGVDE